MFPFVLIGMLSTAVVVGAIAAIAEVGTDVATTPCQDSRQSATAPGVSAQDGSEPRPSKSQPSGPPLPLLAQQARAAAPRWRVEGSPPIREQT